MLKFQLLSGPSWQTESISLNGTGSMQPTYSIPTQSLYVMIPDDVSIVSAKEKNVQSLKTAEQLKAEAEEKACQEAEAKAQQEIDE